MKENKSIMPTEKTKSNCKDEEDLLYTYKPESRNSSIQWNSNFCRKIGRWIAIKYIGYRLF